MTSQTALPAEVAAWVGKILSKDVDPARLDAKLIEDYGADSMDIVDIAERIERTYSVRVSNNQITSIRTFGDLVKLITAIR